MRLRYCLLACLLALPLDAMAHDKRPPYADPPEIKSENGRLELELTVAPRTIEIGGKRVTTTLYNGLFSPPTLRLKRGDKLLLKLRNRKSDDTNLHYHGTNVSPLAPADDVFISVAPKQDYQYEVDFPNDHPQGLFWYHPHWHGTTEYQIGSGLSGLISVDGLLDPWPELKGITEHFMILRDIQIVHGKVPNPPDPGDPTLRTLNGLVNPTIPIRPGEVQLWHVGNVGADIYYDLEIEGHKIYELARDGVHHTRPVIYDHLLLPTSARTEFLIVGGEPGEYVFRTRKIDMGPAGDPHPKTTLATLVSSGPRQTAISLPKIFPALTDLRAVTPCCRRNFDFSETSDGDQFCINNAQTDMSVINTKVRIGCVEEWTINNCSAENHVFHHHQLQFQVIKQNGKDVPFSGLQDTVNLDYRVADKHHPNRCKCDDDGHCTGCTCPTADDPHGSVVVLVPYLDPVMTGKSVYHCHIAEHEDNGMMQVISMSPDAGKCEAGTPSSIDRLDMSPRDRALCKPRKHHKHAEAAPLQGDLKSASALLAHLRKMAAGEIPLSRQPLYSEQAD